MGPFDRLLEIANLQMVEAALAGVPSRNAELLGNPVLVGALTARKLDPDVAVANELPSLPG